MEIFLDTANISVIKKWINTGLINGITTNPTHLAKEGNDPVKQIEKIIAIIGQRDISVQVTETAPEKVYKQAKKIAAIASNVVVKIPCHQIYYEIINSLIQEDVQINITLVFTLAQGLYMSKLGVKYISPFIGRLDDLDIDGLALLSDLHTMKHTYHFSTKILAASIRSIQHLQGAIRSGVDIATIPESILETSTHHILTDQGMQKFIDDWNELHITQFP